jgi:hypothetical protein
VYVVMLVSDSWVSLCEERSWGLSGMSDGAESLEVEMEVVAVWVMDVGRLGEVSPFMSSSSYVCHRLVGVGEMITRL